MENMTSPGTLLSGDNATWLEEYYQTWLRTPEKLPEDWRRFFLSPELTVQSVSGDNNVSGATLKKQAAVIQLSMPGARRGICAQSLIHLV